MRTSTCMGLMFTVVVLVGADVSGGSAATVKGVVRDAASGEGLGSVDVTVTVGGKALSMVKTKGTGGYVVTGVPSGPFTVVISKPGYVFNPTNRDGKTPPGMVMIEDVRLSRQDADNQYFQMVAKRDVQRVQQETRGGSEAQRRDAYARLWDDVDRMGIEPGGRAAYAQALIAEIPDVVDFKLPKLSDYARVKPDTLRTAQAQTAGALNGDKPLPDKNVLKQQGLSDVVIGDVAASTLKASSTSDAAKRDFVIKIQKTYGDAAAITLMKTLEKSVEKKAEKKAGFQNRIKSGSGDGITGIGKEKGRDAEWTFTDDKNFKTKAGSKKIDDADVQYGEPKAKRLDSSSQDRTTPKDFQKEINRERAK
jgi:carboxypeptidase family protein